MTTYDWTVTIDGVNVSALVVGGGTIDYGRPTRASGFQAPVAQFDLLTRTTFPNYTGTWPTVDLGDPVIIHVTWDGITQWRRFTGVVQALDWNPGGLRVTATGTSVDWQNLKADGLEDYMSPYIDDVEDEPETDRVQRLCDDAGVSITIEGVPARRVRGIPAGELPQPLLEALLRVADDCDALLLEDRLGVVHYRTRNFDRPAPYTIPADIIERDSIDLAYERGTHINAVRVFYGEPDATTGQQDYVYSNDTATYGTVVTMGERIADVYTDIQYDGGATGKASVYLEKNRLAWEIPDVTLIMSEATGAQADDILDLQENWMVTVGSLPTGCPIASYDGDILGMTDIMSEQDYRIVLHLGPRIADTSTPEEPIFAAESITGGTTSTYEDVNGFLWQLHVWDTPGSYTITCNEAVTGEALVIGGGGGGGNGNSFRGGGGGGAGAVLPRDIALTPGSINVTVGAGGTPTVSGGTSKLAGAWAYGGGAGGNAQASGVNGGCGGGAGQNGAAVGVATYGSLDSGTTTNTTVVLGATGNFGTGRGGAGGGLSYVSTITNTSVTYSVGGAQSPGGSSGTGPNGATPGSGGGGGGTSSSSGGSGAAGIVVYRYRIG